MSTLQERESRCITTGHVPSVFMCGLRKARSSELSVDAVEHSVSQTPGIRMRFNNMQEPIVMQQYCSLYSFVHCLLVVHASPRSIDSLTGAGIGFGAGGCNMMLNGEPLNNVAFTR